MQELCSAQFPRGPQEDPEEVPKEPEDPKDPEDPKHPEEPKGPRNPRNPKNPRAPRNPRWMAVKQGYDDGHIFSAMRVALPRKTQHILTDLAQPEVNRINCLRASPVPPAKTPNVDRAHLTLTAPPP